MCVLRRISEQNFPHHNLQNCHTQKPIDAHIDENTHKYTYIKKLTPQSVLSAHNSSYLNKCVHVYMSLRAHASIVFGCRASSLFSVDIYNIFVCKGSRWCSQLVSSCLCVSLFKFTHVLFLFYLFLHFSDSSPFVELQESKQVLNKNYGIQTSFICIYVNIKKYINVIIC